jgi:hypothetical protein
MKRKRKAHFLSRFFLAGFTLAGDQSGFLHVHSKKQSRTWRARAGEAGHQRDLFTPEGASFSPNDFEDAFAAVEGDIAPVLRKVIRFSIHGEVKQVAGVPCLSFGTAWRTRDYGVGATSNSQPCFRAALRRGAGGFPPGCAHEKRFPAA